MCDEGSEADSAWNSCDIEAVLALSIFERLWLWRQMIYLKTNGQTMQRSADLPCGLEVLVQLLCSLQSKIKKGFC